MPLDIVLTEYAIYKNDNFDMPLDYEFGIVYMLYFILYVYLLYKIVRSGRTNRLQLIVILLLSITLNLYFYLGSGNLEQESSIVVLFYSLIIWIFTTAITIINRYQTK